MGWESWPWTSYSRWSLAASFALFVISNGEAIDAATILLLTLGQRLEQICAFETHFANALVETSDAEAFRVIVFVDLDQATLELDAFLFVRCLH